MIRLAIILTAMAVTVFIQPGIGRAATLSKAGAGDCAYRIDGQIMPGDFDIIAPQLERAIETAGAYDIDEPLAHSPFAICLNSPGGSLNEATRIARFFIDKWIGTVIGEGDSCLSACAIMFMMGSTNGDYGYGLRRKMHYTATLGLHRPAVDLPGNQSYDAGTVEKAFDIANETLLRFAELANTRLDLTGSIFIHPDLMQNMLQHEGQDFFHVDTVGKALRFEIELFGFDTPHIVDAVGAHRLCFNMFTVGSRASDDVYYWGEGSTNGDLSESGTVTFDKLDGNDSRFGYFYRVYGQQWQLTKSECLVGAGRWDHENVVTMNACGGSWSGFDNFPGNAFCLFNAPGDYEQTGKAAMPALMKYVPAYAVFPLDTPLRDIPKLAGETRERIRTSPDHSRMMETLGDVTCADAGMC